MYKVFVIHRNALKNKKISQKNVDGIFPLHFAVESFCADNLRTILKTSNVSATSKHDNYEEVQYAMIINAKLKEDNNYLHMLINKMTEKNYEDISDMIKAMLLNGCNPNHPNDRSETAFYLLLNKLHDIKADNDLITFCVAHTNVDFYSHNGDDVIRMMIERSLNHKVVPKRESIKDVNFMIQLLDNKNETDFMTHFEQFKSASKHLHNDLAKLLEAAVVRNLSRFAELLISGGADVNGTDSEVMTPSPAYLACTHGHYEVLKILLKSLKLNFKCDKARSSLLHQIFLSKSIHRHDRKKCFDLIITDRRCTLDIINGEDSKGQTPLFLACHYGFDDIAKELLRRGAYIGHEAIINNMEKEVLKDFLDECIKCSCDVGDKNCEIHVDYRFLVPPDVHEETHSEMTAVHEIAGNSKLKDLILHPVLTSYLKLKWRQIDFVVYFNLLVYFCFMIFLGVFVINYFRDSVYTKPMNGTDSNSSDKPLIAVSRFSPNPHFAQQPAPPMFSTLGLSDQIPSSRNNNQGFAAASPPMSNDAPPLSEAKASNQSTPAEKFEAPSIFKLLFGIGSSNKRSKRSTEEDTAKKLWNQRFEQHFEDNALSYRVCLLGVLLMTIYEIVQCYSSWRKYFFKFSNWLDIGLIFLSYVVLLGWSFEVDPEDFKKVRAIMILLMAAQSIQLVAKISVLSMSLHMAIFKRVCGTFLKTISLYLIMILAFAMSFYTMNDDKKEEENPSTNSTETKNEDDDEKTFSDPFMSVITTVRMMLSDFDNVKINAKDRFQGSMFLLFIVLITVVLYNLLNALAISDTNNIIKDAELVDTQKRISILYSYEKLFFFLSPSFINILPRMSTIMLTPNSDNTIKIKRRFGMIKDVTVIIHKTAKPEKFENVYTRKWMFWKKRPFRLSNKFMKKFVDFIRSQQAQKIMEINREVVYAKFDEISKELLNLKLTQSVQGETMEGIVRILCRREKFLEDSKSEKFKTIQTDELFM